MCVCVCVCVYFIMTLKSLQRICHGLWKQSCNTKRQNFQYNKFHGNPKFVFPFKSHIHSSSFVSNSKQTKHKSLDLFYDTNMLTKNEQCEEVEMNPKAQVVFLHIIVYIIFKYKLQVKDTTLACQVTQKLTMDEL